MTESPAPRIIVERCPQCGANLPPGGEEVTCEYCGSRLRRQRPAVEKATGVTAQGIRLKTFCCVDQQGIGIEAFRMLVPAEWEVSGGIQWILDRPGMPAGVALLIRNPASEEALEILPALGFYWTNNPLILMTMPVGSMYFGNEVRQPMPATQVLREIIVPRYRGGIRGLQIVGVEQLPDLPGQLQAIQAQASPQAAQPMMPPGMISYDGASTHLRYSRNGKAIEEKIFTVVPAMRINMPTFGGMMENIWWQADYLICFRAEAGQLESASELFQMLVRSFRISPQWYAGYMQVIQFLTQRQIQQIRHIGQISRIISQTSSEISDSMMASYYQQQQIMDRISDKVSQTIRGVDEYYNPIEERGVELPGGYNHAWTNSLGEYILSNDPNLNPNIGSNLNWEPMERKS